MSELNKQLLEAIKEVTADTGNWGEHGGQNKQSQIEAANECEKICLEQTIKLIESFKNHIKDESELAYNLLLAQEKYKLKQLNQYH